MTNQESERDPGRFPFTAADVFDAAWEARTRRSLEPTGWNADLAVHVSRDALAVLAGQMTEEEFQARHHDAYMKEFGVDLRPPEEGADAAEAADESIEPAPASVGLATAPDPATSGHGAPAEHPGISRRAALAMAGTGLAALLIGDLLSVHVKEASADGLGHDDGDPNAHPANQGHGGSTTSRSHKQRMGMVIDLDRCDGCLMCVATCKKEYGLPDGVHWLYVLAYKEPERHTDDVNFLVRPCQHCAKAPCVKVCPTGARHRRGDGLVLTDYDVCFGCRYCQVSCPYGVNYFGWDDPKDAGGGFQGERKDGRGKSVIGAPPRGVMGKCIFCPGRQDSPHNHATTHCSEACPMGVIHYGDLNDPESEPMRYLRGRVEESGGKLSTFRLLEELGTEPNVIYIGHKPSHTAEPTTGPTRYEDWGMVHERRIVLEGPEPWFKRMVGR